MDVTCERCGTEYEFEETLVSDRGTTVKCTHCGHLFKVYRGGRPSSPTAAPDPWTLRRRNGTTLTISALRDLQRFITRGELSREDEISRKGEPWKALGSIAELQSFFTAARALGSVPPASMRPRPDATAPFLAAVNTPYRPSPSSHPVATDSLNAADYTETTVRDQARPSMTGQLFPPAPAFGRAPPGAAPPATRGIAQPIAARTGSTLRPGAVPPAPVAFPQPRPAPAPPSPPSVQPVPAAVVRSAPPPRAVVSRDAIAQTLPARPMRLHVDEDDEQLSLPRTRSRIGLWIALVAVAVMAGSVIAGWSQIMSILGFEESDGRLAGFLARGDRSLARDDPPGYATASNEYIRATALDERNVRALVSLATVNAAWAQTLQFRASDLEASAANDPTLRGEANRLRTEQREKADEARRYAEDALRQDPTSTLAEIALSDALRLSGDRSGARNHLARARASQPDPSAELLLVSGLLQADDASGDLTVARSDLEAAVRKAPRWIRARLTLARALLRAPDPSAARAQIEAVLSLAADHPEALHLRQAMDQGLPPAAPVVVVPDAGVPDAAPAPPPSTTEIVPPVSAVAPTEPTAPLGAPPGRDYDWYVEQADLRITRGDIGGAREYAEEALGQRPNGAEALTILGAIAVDTGDFGRAIELYRRAAQQGYSDAWVELGDTYRAIGRRTDAIAAYEEYLARRPDGSRAVAARNHLENLRRQEPPATPPEQTTPLPAPGSEPPIEPAPPPSSDPRELPAPIGADPNNPPPSSDTPAVGSEP